MSDRGRIVLSTPRDAIAVVTIDRPAKRNALTPAMFDELSEVVVALGAGERIRACVITGAGAHFCAGGDVTAFGDLRTEADRRAQLERAFRAFRAIEIASFPVIAAVDGVAHAGGMELVLASDIVLATDRATFALPEVKVGLMPGFGLTRAFPRLGHQRAAMLALTGEPIDAERALAWGLVASVVSPGELHATALRLASSIADRPAAAVRSIKQFASDAREAELDGVAETIVELFASEDHARIVGEWRRRS